MQSLIQLRPSSLMHHDYQNQLGEWR